MSKYACLGNGELLIGLDRFGQVKDLYFHYPGLENHINENQVHKIGVWIDGGLYWVDSPEFNVSVVQESETMAARIVISSDSLGLRITFEDVIYNEKNIFIRDINIENLFDHKREVKIFFNQQFNIAQDHIGNTAFFDPDNNCVIHYKGRRVFLFNACMGEIGITDYSVGLLGIEGKDGTFKDAEDGVLSKNGIEHGQVDSTFSVEFDLPSKKSKRVCYFMCAGKSIEKVVELNAYVLKRTSGDITKTTKDYWRAWVNNQNFSFYSLSDDITSLFKKSLFIIRSHTAKNGAIIASSDSDMLQFGRDTYVYVWPRDGAIASIALARAGDFNASRRFLEFCRKVVSSDGYFMHKYRPDHALGSSWHAWIEDGKKRLPIQEDGTALVIYALWNYFELSKDLEFVESVYNELIKAPAEFMSGYVDKDGLIKPSFDLWEMYYAVNTFTASTVYRALVCASGFAKLLGKTKSAEKYDKAAQGIRSAIEKKLYSPKDKYFYKHIFIKDGKETFDSTVDASGFFGLYKFKVFDPDTQMMKDAYETLIRKLQLNTESGGIARFEGDQYHHPGGNVPGNPWILTTLWNTQYKISQIKSEQDLPSVVSDLTWVTKKALPSGILPEQINAYTSEPLSAAPLVWSHAEYVITIVKYLEKLEELGICKACYPIK
ncbi:MAG: Glycoside hydrolase [Microgenomates group bacterium GW2011_GWF1_38_5]|nr:MAG: Glycoside hydrolase [Microgenomates group bacterium GW2011_GWF1_38_5]